MVGKVGREKEIVDQCNASPRDDGGGAKKTWKKDSLSPARQLFCSQLVEGRQGEPSRGRTASEQRSGVFISASSDSSEEEF
jgi:hypothetical protein